MSRLQGAQRLRRLLRGLPDGLRDELGAILQQTGDELLAQMEADVPTRTGRLRRALRLVLSAKALRLRVGLVGKVANRKLFYGRIVNFGRRAQTVRVYRHGRSAAPADGKFRGRPFYLMKVSAMRPRPFAIRPRPELWKRFYERFNARWATVLKRAAGG